VGTSDWTIERIIKTFLHSLKEDLCLNNVLE